LWLESDDIPNRGSGIAFHRSDDYLAQPRPSQMTPSTPGFSTVEDSAGFQSLREPWNALWASLDHRSLFSSFDWCWNAWRLVAVRRGYKLRLVCGRADGRLVLIWPMVEDSSVLRMLTSDTFEYRDILVLPTEHASRWVEDAWSYVAATTRANTFFFQNLRRPNALSEKLSRMTNAKPIGGWSPLVRLDQFADWDAYASTLPKSLQSDQRRQWKRVCKVLPGMSFRVVERADKIEPAMDWICRHKLAWSEVRGKHGWFNAEDILLLLKSTARSALDDGRLVLAALSDGDTTISAGWGYVCGSEFLFYAFAYDKAYATYSPSRLFLEKLLQHCFRNSIRTFDFMPGGEAYKRIWATDYVRQESYIGTLNWRGELLLRLSTARIAARLPAVLRDAYGNLPLRWRKAVQRKLRPYRVVNYALNQSRAPKTHDLKSDP